MSGRFVIVCNFNTYMNNSLMGNEIFPEKTIMYTSIITVDQVNFSKWLSMISNEISYF